VAAIANGVETLYVRSARRDALNISPRFAPREVKRFEKEVSTYALECVLTHLVGLRRDGSVDSSFVVVHSKAIRNCKKYEVWLRLRNGGILEMKLCPKLLSGRRKDLGSGRKNGPDDDAAKGSLAKMQKGYTRRKK
jgi:hypothetical protein